MSKKPNIYTRQQFDDLKLAQRKIHDLLPVFDGMESCGMECQELKQVTLEMQRILGNIEAEFMTPPPKK